MDLERFGRFDREPGAYALVPAFEAGDLGLRYLHGLPESRA
jgi:hypothetical protein